MVSLSSKSQSNQASKTLGKEALLQIRSTLKHHRPKFIRQQGTMIKRIGLEWRAPKGDQSKVKLNIKGKRPQPMIGYGNPKLVRWLTKNGMREILVNNLSQLKSLKLGVDEVVVFSRSLGMKQKMLLAEYANGAKIRVKGIPNIAEFIQSCKKIIGDRKQNRQQQMQAKIKSAPQKTVQKKAEAVSEEEKKKQEEEEKRKVLEAR